MLEVSGLSVRYGQHVALDGASLTVDRGEIVVILGANGAGKSTLLKAIAGICEGTVSGAVRLDGEDLAGLPPDRIVEGGIALVPEGRGVFGDLTVAENLRLGANPARARSDEAAILDRVHGLFPKLRERAGQVVRTMSGGEQQMVAIGRAMMSNPQILALDEPSLGLSPLLTKELFQSLRRVRALGLGVLLVEQNARQSLAIADRGYLLENARIVHQDRAEALRSDAAVQAAYLGAGGQAAPHTHDTPPVPTAEAPAAFPLRPRPMPTQSADALLGRSIADLVASASERSAARPAPAIPATGPAADRLAATLADIERAAQAARRRRTVERPMPKPGEPPAPPPAEPVTVEVWRAPRVEVWRRRPGSPDFDRQ